ncbi:hypothetical protein KUTeg_011113 [Tegillarca granosa]|uniref:H-type lectin domain-containing protein n=1 Tax=Tegillarca granosa TaxID=220873 RepID=A0ABQ9F802_TEGGR|nr:hypothetical protein KUTeg_011113 [Tegillarca granosa]
MLKSLLSFPKTPSWPGIRTIIFHTPFSRTPSIVHGVTLLDSNSNKNLRIKVSTNSISRFGFTLKLATWGDTVLYGLTVRWMACR